MLTFLRILTFGLIGPPVGMVVMLFGTASYDYFLLGTTGDFSMVFGSLISPPMLAICYVFGGVPALLDGILASVLARRVNGGLLYFWAAAAGAVLSAIFVCWVILGGSSGIDPMKPWAFVGIVAATGAGAGVISLGVFDGVTRLRQRRPQPA
jgi:hypothetical protein